MFTFFVLVSHILAIEINQLSLKEALDTVKTGWSFILAANPQDFEYVQLVREFKKAAHFSKINAHFIILDVSTIELQKSVQESLNATQFPCCIFTNNGATKRIQYRGFDDEYLLSFMSTNAVNPPQTIKTKEELDLFYSTTGTGLIIAFKDASPESYPNLVDYYYDFFAEVVVAFADPSLFESEGFYLYRYIDSVVVRLPDNLTNLSFRDISRTIGANLLPEFTKVTTPYAGYLESLKQKFVILMLVMEDFYLTKEQLQLARDIKAKTGLNVTYADVENSQVVSVVYGLPDSLDSTLSVIDPTSKRVLKYMLPETLNLDNAVKLIKSIEEGKATPYFKSESEGHSSKIGCQMQSINAKGLQNIVKSKKSAVLALYVSSHDPMEEYVNATEVVKPTFKDVVYGKFSLNTNDWPLEEIDDTIDFPILYILKNGKRTYVNTLGNTTEAVTLQITEALNKNTEL